MNRFVIIVLLLPFVIVGLIAQFFRVGYGVAGDMLNRFANTLLKRSGAVLVERSDFNAFVEEQRKNNPSITNEELVDAYMKKLNIRG